MAGRFLSVEETAQRLGVSVDEVNRLVDRKKLFPMRDGAAIKFKVDDVEAVAGNLGEESSRFDDLSLDIRSGSAIGSGSGAPALSGIDADDLVLDDLAIDDEKDAASVFIDEPPAPGAGTGSGALSLDSLSGGSSPVLGGGGRPHESGTLAIDLSDATSLGDISGGSLVVGSGAGLAKGSGSTGAGAALSGVLDSGLSLEDDDAALTTLGASGIELGADGGLDSGSDDAATMLGSADDFELGGLGGDDESASVVIAAEESTESSFFTDAMAGASSGFSEESSASSMAVSADEGFPGIRMTPDTRFSALQICGLVCCTLMLLTGGFVALDLVRTIGSPDATKMANPLLDALSEAFGWR